MSKAFVTVVGYKNQYCVQVHNGDYALNIKYYHDSHIMNDIEYQMAFDYAEKVFFNRVKEIVNIFGYTGFYTDGNSGGWLKPFYGNRYPVKASYDDYISFTEHVEQEKLFSMFQIIKKHFDNLKMLLNYSETYSEFEKELERYLSL